MEAQQRIEQIVVIALLVILAVGCLTVLRPFLSALLWALVLSFSAVYLPQGTTEYAIVLTFVLLALVLAFRPHGLFGRVE